MAKNQETLYLIDLIGPALEEARPYGLQTEVVASIIQRMREIPGIDIEVAISDALADWDL